MKEKFYKTENEFKAAAGKWLKETYGESVWFYPPSDRFYKAIPDFIICFFGLFVAPEFKLRDTYDVQPLQKVVANKILRAHGHSFCCRDMNEFKMKIKSLEKIINK